MDPKRLRELLGLPENASDEQVSQKRVELKEALEVGGQPDGDPAGDPPKGDEGEKALTEFVKKILTESASGEGEGDKGEKPEGDKGGSFPGGSIRMSEAEREAFKKIAETNPTIKQLLEHVVASDREHAKTLAALRLSEVNRRLDEVTIGPRFALSAAIREDVKAILLDTPTKYADKLYEALGKIVDGSGLVPLGETRVGSDWRKMNGSATKTLDDLVQKKMSEQKLSYADAVVVVSGENPSLLEAYYAENEEFGGVR